MKQTFINPRIRRGIPAFHENAALQLIVACGVGFILYQLATVSLLVYNNKTLSGAVSSYVGLSTPENLGRRWWTVLTYGFIHHGFWSYLSNMLWLYAIANVVQGLLGFRQVIPLFVYSVLMGGLLGVGLPLLGIPQFGPATQPVLTAAGGILGLAAAALTVAPRYRFYLGERFSFPFWILPVIFLLLNVMAYPGGHGAIVGVALGGLAMGFAYAKLLNAGHRPGAWMYRLRDRVSHIGEPKEHSPRTHRRQDILRYEARNGSVSQKRIDDILDKISQRGYESLTKEEKEILMRASKDHEQG